MEKNLNIPFKGMNYTTPSSISEDGDTLKLVNLRPKENSLMPVGEPEQLCEINQDYDFIYIHSHNELEIWLGVLNNKLYLNIKEKAEKVCEIQEQILQIKHISNTLILITNQFLHYLLYKNGNYKYLGTKPPLVFARTLTLGEIITSKFSEFEGTISDIQLAMEALLTRTHWKDNHYKLTGVYLMRYALKLYDGSYILHSSPVLITHLVDTHPYTAYLAFKNNVIDYQNSSVEINFYNVRVTIDTSDLVDWSDIITGVDIFLSTELGMVKDTYEKWEDTVISDENNIKTIKPQNISKDEILENISNNGNFYLVGSIAIQNKTSSITIGTNEENNLQNLVFKTQLSGDDFSHHHITGDTTYVYNQRLHLANITTTFTNNLPLRAFTPRTYLITGLEKTAQKTYTEYYIKTETENELIISEYGSMRYVDINAFISYPDTRAYKAIIYICNSNNVIQQTLEVELQPHNSLNIAYYCNRDLTANKLQTASGTYNKTSPPLTIKENGKLKVSALNNAFKFPNENTYLFNNTISGMASNAISVAQGQFGQYPLYIFTLEGIYTLAVGQGDIVYSNISPISFEVALPHSVLPLSEAVFFLTSRGAYIIAGSQTINISTPLNTYTPYQKMQHYEKIKSKYLTDLIEITNFLVFIQDTQTKVHYNYQNNEIHLTNTDIGFSYIFNLDSKQWYIQTFTFKPVLNTYPNSYGIQNNILYDLSQENQKDTDILLLTRPIKLGTQTTKHLRRIILRSHIISKNAAIHLYVSKDSINFKLKTVITTKNANYRDLDFGLLVKNKYPYYAIIIAGKIGNRSRINYLQCILNPDYINEKMR